MVFSSGGFRKDNLNVVLEQVKLTSTIGFRTNDKELTIRDEDSIIKNFIFFESDDNTLRPFSQYSFLYKDYSFLYEELMLKTHYLDYMYLSRYFSDKSLRVSIDTFTPSENIDSPTGSILPYIHAKLVGISPKQFMKVYEYVISENIRDYLMTFDKFLNDLTDSSLKFLHIRLKYDNVPRMVILKGIEDMLKFNYILDFQRKQITVPKFNFTVLSYLLNTYNLPLGIFSIDTISTGENTKKVSFVVPTIYDSIFTINSSNFQKVFRNKKIEKVTLLRTIFDDIVERPLSETFNTFSQNFIDNKVVLLDMGELVISIVHFRFFYGIVFMEKYVVDGHVYLRVIKDFSRVVPTSDIGGKYIMMSLDKLERFVNRYSKGVTTFFIDWNSNKLFIVHIPKNEYDTIYYTEVKISDYKDKIGVVDGWLILGNHKIKMYKSYGYVLGLY